CGKLTINSPFKNGKERWLVSNAKPSGNGGVNYRQREFASQLRLV
ncbi:MAG: hypothetical protein ACI9P8_001675, partial [Bacteroidia bacterium]